MLERICKYIFIQSAMLAVLFAPAFAEKMTDAAGSLNPQGGKHICTFIKENIKKGVNLEKIIKTSIQMGYSACLVIKCAIEGGGNLEQVLTGAVEAGVTPDVVSRCAVDTGANAKQIAAILNTISLPGICYMLPENTEINYPLNPPNPPVTSPSKF